MTNVTIWHDEIQTKGRELSQFKKDIKTAWTSRNVVLDSLGALRTRQITIDRQVQDHLHHVHFVQSLNPFIELCQKIYLDKGVYKPSKYNTIECAWLGFVNLASIKVWEKTENREYEKKVWMKIHFKVSHSLTKIKA